MKKKDRVYDLVREQTFIISNIKMSYFIDTMGNSHHKSYCIMFDKKQYYKNTIK